MLDTVEKLSEEELQDYYEKEVKKGVNEQFIENFAEPALAFTEPRDTGGNIIEVTQVIDHHIKVFWVIVVMFMHILLILI